MALQATSESWALSLLVRTVSIPVLKTYLAAVQPLLCMTTNCWRDHCCAEVTTCPAKSAVTSTDEMEPAICGLLPLAAYEMLVRI